MKILDDLNLEFREAVYMNGPGQWLWPKEDEPCWKYFNESERDIFKSKGTDQRPYHLPHDILTLLPANKRNLIMQAGGNGGLYPAIYSEFFKQVITFEPHYRWFTCLSVNAPAENVFKYRAALGNDNEPVHIVTPTGNMGGMFVKPDGIIPKLRLDAFGLAPDLIHLDIEGAEWSALQGAAQTITWHRPMIVVEWDGSTMRQFNYTEREFEQYFESIEYVLQKSWGRDRAYVHTTNYQKDLS
jgi:FkbM family methyltransferase